MKTLKEITPAEVDQFIEDFNISGLFTLNKLKKQLSKRSAYADKYDWAKIIKYKVFLHRDKWYEITPDNLSQASLMLSEKGVLYYTTESGLILYKSVKYNSDLQIIPIKKSPSLYIDIFGIGKGMLPYFEYFSNIGFCAIQRSVSLDKNAFIDIKYEKVKILG